MPRLKPTHECTVIPQEICQLKFDTPREEIKPFMSKWCIDPNEEPVPDNTYDDTQVRPLEYINLIIVKNKFIQIFLTHFLCRKNDVIFLASKKWTENSSGKLPVQHF